MFNDKYISVFKSWQADWNRFAHDVLKARLDTEQQDVLASVQHNKMVAVASGTSRGKDFVAACASLCFLYLTPKFDKNGNMIENTKVAMTAPCYDSETEILTEDGWKFFFDLTYNDKVAQMGEGGKIEYVHPTDIINEPYHGEMIGCKTKLIDFLVTPNHRCLFSNCNVSSGEAKRINSIHESQLSKNPDWSQYKTAEVCGKSQSYVAKCIKAAKYIDGFAGEVRKAKDIYGKNGLFAKVAYFDGDVQNKDWMEFLGFWFAEGSFTFNEKQRKYRITVTQTKSENIAYVDDLISRIQPLLKNKFHKYPRKGGGYNWELYDKELSSEFVPYGKQLVRSIPKWVKNSDIASMKAFLKGFIVGDGSIDKNGSVKLCTSSDKLADDLHEMCIKVGWIANKKEYFRKSRDKIIEGRNVTVSSHFYYEVKLSPMRGNYPHVMKKHWYKKDYHGFVHCVTVPSGMVMIRRNGFNMWSGNTGRQVKNIMTPEIRRLFRAARVLPGRLVSDDIRTDFEEWFLTGFKAGDDATEAWSGFHASNTMFVVTEASGISEMTFNAIEGNLQGNSRLLLVFNPNVTTGYAARAMKSERFKKFRLNSLNAENVVKKNIVIPGQVDYEWVKDKVHTWCTSIHETDFNEGEGDFRFEGGIYRPNDLFRVKVLGMFPKVSEDNLIPYEWINIANKRWLEFSEENFIPHSDLRLGVDVAGMGRDSSVLCYRYDNYLAKFVSHQSGGSADHMHIAGMVSKAIRTDGSQAFIDTIGEGAGVYSRLRELGYENAFSCKFSESARDLTDITGVYTFANMKAYLYWCVRDWLNPANKFNAAVPLNDRFLEEATDIKWKFQSNGSIIIEPKEETIKRLKRSPDLFDSLANTFYPSYVSPISEEELLKDFR